MTQATRLLIVVGLGRFYPVRFSIQLAGNLFEHGSIALDRDAFRYCSAFERTVTKLLGSHTALALTLTARSAL